MPINQTIRVDFQVWRELQARRETEAMTENDVIRGLLGLKRRPPSPPPPPPPPPPSSRVKLKVIFPDGEEIYDTQVSRTFVRAIEKIGPGRVFELNIPMAGKRLVEKRRGERQAQWKSLSNGFYVNTGSNTDNKREQLEYICRELGENFRVEEV